MRKMFSENQIKEIVKESPSEVVEALKGQDINVEGITSKGIANTGNIANTGDIATSGKITGGEIVENMSGYSFVVIGSPANTTREFIYAGVVKNGNKITFALALNLTNTTGTQDSSINIGRFYIPSEVLSHLFPTQIGSFDFLEVKKANLYSSHAVAPISLTVSIEKRSEYIELIAWKIDNLVQDTKYYLRFDITFLLSENLAPSGE